eukprot:349656-Chlamydomonas_euryale.AAC.4
MPTSNRRENASRQAEVVHENDDKNTGVHVGSRASLLRWASSEAMPRRLICDSSDSIVSSPSPPTS